MDLERIRAELLAFLRPSYPEIQLQLARWDQDLSKVAIYFTDPKFALIYPQQRFHYLSHLIPEHYQETHLTDTVWFELAPGEHPSDLRYPDEQLISDITPDVTRCLLGAKVFEALDDELCPVDARTARAECHGDFRTAKRVLLSHGFTDDEVFDVLHVLMAQGGFCDCEILFNVARSSRLATQRWSGGAEATKPAGGQW
jgi:hypothetical protein